MVITQIVMIDAVVVVLLIDSRLFSNTNYAQLVSDQSMKT